MQKRLHSVSTYIAAAPKASQPTLRQLRNIITTTIPDAEEKLSYGMPYYSYHGRLAYFAAFRDHCSFFVMNAGRKAFAKQMAPYLASKSTMHFPHGGKVPVRLIQRILKEQAKSNAAM